MKKCNTCKIDKDSSCFYKCKKSKDGLTYQCKDCNKLYMNTYRRTKQGLITAIYGRQVYCSKKRGHKLPEYTKQELSDWLNKQINFDCLYLNWINSGYNSRKIPSVDRIDNYKGYSLGNIRLVTWQENDEKGHFDRKNGINNKQSVAVSQFDLDGNLVKEYFSIIQAWRETGIKHSDIGQCCMGKGKTAGGFKWARA